MTNPHRARLALSCAVAALAAGALSQPVLAQDEGETVREREVIVVTSRRQEETLQTVPGAVSAFSEAELLEDLAAENVGVLQGLVPNLNLVQGRGSSSSANIFIRGVGQPDALATFDPAVGVYVDDVYISRIRGALFDVYDIERIEVLRGPQGTLYGKNTNGGALRIVTRQPGDEFEANGRFSYGSYNAIEANASVSGPIAPGQLFGGATVYYGGRDGYVDDPITGDEYNDKDTFGLRGSLRWTPTSNVELSFAADYTHENPNLTVGQPVNGLFAVDIAPLDPTLAIVPTFTPTGEEYDFVTATSLSRAGFPGSETELQNSNELDHWGVSATASWDLNDRWTLRSITAYRDLEYTDFIDIDATPLELGDVLVDVEQDQASQEFQVLYNGDRLRGVGGVFWLNENIDSFQQAYADDFLLAAGAPLPFTRDIEDSLSLHSWAAFANLVFDVNDRLSLTGGLRYTYELKRYSRGTTTTFDPVGVGFDVSEDWSDVSPLFSIDYQFTDEIFGYARFSRGFKSGGFNGRANNPNEEQPYDPEIVNSFEIGARTTWGGGRVILNGNVFYNDYQDFQARVSDTIDLPGPGGALVPTAVFTVLNAGQLDIYGAEVEFLAEVYDNFTVDAQLGLLNAEYGEFLDQRYPGGDRADFEEPAFAPEITARLGGAYTWTFDNIGELTLGASASYRDAHALAVDQSEQALLPFGTVDRIDEAFQEAYTLYDARLVLADFAGNWSAGIYGRNLSDEVYATDFQEFSSVGGIRTAYFGAPRTVTFQITARR